MRDEAKVRIRQMATEIRDMVIDHIAAEVHDLMIGDQTHGYSLYKDAPDDVKTFYRKLARWHLQRLELKVADGMEMIADAYEKRSEVDESGLTSKILGGE